MFWAPFSRVPVPVVSRTVLVSQRPAAHRVASAATWRSRLTGYAKRRRQRSRQRRHLPSVTPFNPLLEPERQILFDANLTCEETWFLPDVAKGVTGKNQAENPSSSPRRPHPNPLLNVSTVRGRLPVGYSGAGLNGLHSRYLCVIRSNEACEHLPHVPLWVPVVHCKRPVAVSRIE